MLWELMTITGIWFWLSVGFFVTLMMWSCTEDERGHEGFGLPTIAALATLVWYQLFTDANPLGWVRHNFLEFLMYVAAYFVMGVLYSFAAWYFYLLNVRDKRKRQRETGYKFVDSGPPSYLDHPERIIAWIAYWPFSGIIKLIKDPLWRIAVKLYHLFGNIYDAITRSVFPSVSAPDEVAPKE